MDPTTDIPGMIQAAATKYGIDPNIFSRQMYQESGFNPKATSSAGAIGVAQLMPDTAKGLGVDPNDTAQNIDGGARYLRQQLDEFGSYPLALAAYNAGPGNVRKGIFPNETQNYVRSILGGGRLTQGTPHMPTGADQTNSSGVLSSSYGLPPGLLNLNSADAVGSGLQDAGAYLMGINNPSALSATNHNEQYRTAQLRNLLAMKPEWTQVGQGLFGPRYGFVSPMAALMRGAGGGGGAPGAGAPGAPGGAPGGPSGSSINDMTPDQFGNLMNQYQTGKISKDDIVKQTGLLGTYAQSLADGTGDPRMLGNRAGELRPMAIMLAKVLNPNMPFDENAISARQQYNRLMATGKSDPSVLPGAVAALGKLSEHALQVAQTSEGLGGNQLVPNVSAANAVENWYQKNFGTNSSYKGNLNALQTIGHTYSQEQDRLATGGHPTLTGAAASEAGLTGEKSHYERMRSLGESFTAAMAPLDQMVSNHNAIFGENKTVNDFLDAKTKDNIAKVQDAISRSAQGNTGPQASSGPSMPQVGEVRQGFKFKGGNPADPNSWEK